MSIPVLSRELARACLDALELVGVLSLPPLLVMLAVAVAVGLVQAATQIQEPTVAAVARLLALFAALVFFGAGISLPLVRFAHLAFTTFPTLR